MEFAPKAMPTYTPTEAQLNAVYNACQTAGLLNLPGGALLTRFEELATDVWPANLAPTGPPLDNPLNLRSLALARALAMSWPVGRWNAGEALHVFKMLRDELLSAWAAHATITENEKLQRTVDHCVATGIKRNWALSLELLECMARGPVHASIDFLRGRPVPRAEVGPGEGMLTFSGGLIPDLECCWGGDFGQDANWAIGAILHQLMQPYATLATFSPGDSIKLDCGEEGISFKQYFRNPVLAGARRNFRLAVGSAELLINGLHFHDVGQDQRIMLRVFDDGKAQIVLARLSGRSLKGPQLDVTAGDAVVLRFTVAAVLEAWACSCGTWECDRRHRLSGWSPETAPITQKLRDFIWNAVKGANEGFKIKTFITGMYYAFLCDGS